jgi:hypothetical protein
LSALIALPAAAYAGRPFFYSAIRAVKARRMNMDVPITVGVLLALGMSVVETLNHAEHAYFDSALMLLAFLLVGRTLEQMMRRRTRAVPAVLTAGGDETKFVSPHELCSTSPMGNPGRSRPGAPGRARRRRRHRCPSARRSTRASTGETVPVRRRAHGLCRNDERVGPASARQHAAQ